MVCSTWDEDKTFRISQGEREDSYAQFGEILEKHIKLLLRATCIDRTHSV